MLDARARGQGGQDLVDVEGAVRERVGELVQDEQPVRLGGQVAPDLLPSLDGGARVVFWLGPQPGPARAHSVPGHGCSPAGSRMQVAQCQQRALLADAPFWALGELEDADGPSRGPGPQGEPEGGGGFSLAVTGMHGEQRLSAPFAGAEPVVGDCADLALRHQATASFARMMRASIWPACSRSGAARAARPGMVTSSAARWRAISPARPRRTGPSSASPTMLLAVR